MDELHRLAEFAAGLTYDVLPADVVERAKWVLRDSLGVILGAMREPEVRAMADYAAHQHPGGSSLFGTGGRTQPEWAALVHGTAGTTLEMDEGHAFARGHAAAHAVGPALALAEAHHASGKEAITALVVGYEVAARVGVATHLRPLYHPFGAWGVLGAAAIAAWFKRMSGADLAGVLETAAVYTIAPSFNTAYQGANVRNTFAGMVNKLGMLAADLYELGFRGEAGGVATVFGTMAGDSFNAAALIDGLGERYEIMRGYFKPYSACRYVHGAVDAVLALRAQGEFDPARIERVEVATYDIAAKLSDPAPKTPLAGRFSTPYVVAATLVRGSAGPEIFTRDMLSDPQILDVARRVTVTEDPAFTALTPAKRPARVRVHFTDGSQREHQVMGSKGDPDQPMTADELETKFHMLTDPTLGAVRAAEVWDRFGQLDEYTDLRDLIGLFSLSQQPEGG